MNRAGPPAEGEGEDLIGNLMPTGGQGTIGLTPAYGGVDVEAKVVARKGLHHQHVQVQALDQHPKEVGQREEVKQGDQGNAAAQATADGDLQENC